MDALYTRSSSYSEIGRINKSDCSIGLEDGKKGGYSAQICNKDIVKLSSPNGRRTEEDKLELAKSEMTKVRDENTKLKKMLQKVERDYHSLHKRFVDVMQPQKSNKNVPEEREFTSLSLGRNNQITETRHEDINPRMEFNLEISKSGFLEKSRENSLESDIAKEDEEKAEVLKATGSNGNDEEVALQQPSAKRARVSVRARCDSATMNDGCQWRKYGQKTAKGNPCPRAYYRCTVALGCPVRKQVQRCMDDMSILITTYEGTHNHPLPISATAMASTTSAAASMLLSGSSTSAAATSSSAFQGLNFSVCDNNNNYYYSRPNPFYLPNTSSQNFSSITLDLTTSSRFSSPHTNTSQYSWGNEYLDNGSMNYNKTPLNSQFYPETSSQAYSHKILTETLTKAIASDPSLRSVINAAISSMVSNGAENKNNTQQAPLHFSL